MADWRQIQARIRKAKNSPDAATKLNELYQRTRDGMVAWELGAIEEKAEHREEAGRWYAIAAQRFRRADWRKKAEEALTRLGMEIPAQAAPSEEPSRTLVDSIASRNLAENAESATEAVPAEDSEDEEPEETAEEGMALADGDAPALQSAAPGNSDAADNGSPAGKRKRRRGRRGGRGRRRRGTGAQGLPSQAYAGSTEPQQARPTVVPTPSHERPAAKERATAEPAPAAYERPTRAEMPAPQLPSERSAHGHGRGDPALASRTAHLESLLRRLLQSPLHRLDECDDAPAGPGVFLLSDSDQTSLYYVEACQTLRIGAANLARGGKSAKGSRGGRGYSGDTGLKARLAEYLGINEAKVSQYMKDHCMLRWIQLDDEAQLLAHFAISVLRTPLNLDE